MRKITTLALLFLCCLTISAKDRNEAEMMQIATRALLGNDNSPSSRATVSTTLEKSVSLNQIAIYSSKGRGFVIVSKDDAFKPVLGVSETGFDANNIPDGLRWWLRETEKSLQYMKEAGMTMSSTRADNSDNYLLTSTWSQGSPYNLFCPVINNETAQTGCVATALSQIMYYYKYPARGKGMGSYTVTDSTKVTGITTTYDNQPINNTYDWANMRSQYINPTPVPTTSNSAVATLMFDAGKAVNMDYAESGSSAMSLDGARALFNNFSYDSLSVNIYDRYFFTDDEWMSMIRTEIEADRPVYYGGNDSIDGGHAFIFDGIRSDNTVHVNWGWGGQGNGYYSIDQLRPFINGIRKTYLTNGSGFNDGQELIIGIKPQATPDAGEENTSYWVTSGYSLDLTDGKLYCTLTDIYNYCCRYFDGRIDLVFKDASTNIDKYSLLLNLYDSNSDTDPEPIVPSYMGFAFYDDNQDPEPTDLSFATQDLQPGTYNVYLGTRSKDEKDYKKVRTFGGPIAYTLTKAANGTLTLTETSTLGINNIHIDRKPQQDRTYLINGTAVNNNSNIHGIFIRNGKKFMRK